MKRFLFILLLLLIPVSGWGDTHTVTTDAEMDTAIGAVDDGDIISVAASFTTAGGVTAEYTVAKQITIQGLTGAEIIKMGSDITYVFYFNGGTAAGSTIQNLVIDGDKANRTDGTGICANVNGVTISGVTVHDMSKTGILIGGSKTSGTVTGCTVTDCGEGGTATEDGIRTNADCSGITITRNTVSGSYRTGIYLNETDSCTVTWNTVTGSGYDGIKACFDSAEPDSSDSNTIAYNTIYDWAKTGAGDGIKIEGASNLVYQNTIYQATDAELAWAIEATGGSNVCDNTEIFKNVMYGAHLDKAFSGGGAYIKFYQNKCYSPIRYDNCDASLFYSNLVAITVDPSSLGYGMYFCAESAGTKTVHAYNNLVYNAGAIAAMTGIRYEEDGGIFGVSNCKNNGVIGFAKGIVFEDKDDNDYAQVETNNGFYNNTKNLQKDVGGVFSDITVNAADKTADPLLLSTYKLRGGSPWVDSGTSISGITKDLRDRAILHFSPDIGAYEYNPVLRRP